MTNSDNGGMPRKHPLAVGTREHGPSVGLHVAAADFPADAFSRVGPAPHGQSRCINLKHAAHEG